MLQLTTKAAYFCKNILLLRNEILFLECHVNSYVPFSSCQNTLQIFRLLYSLLYTVFV